MGPLLHGYRDLNPILDYDGFTNPISNFCPPLIWDDQLAVGDYCEDNFSMYP